MTASIETDDEPKADGGDEGVWSIPRLVLPSVDAATIDETRAALALALACDDAAIFLHQIRWAERFLAGHLGASLGPWLEALEASLGASRLAPLARLPIAALLGEAREVIDEVVDEVVDEVRAKPTEAPEPLPRAGHLEELFQDYFRALLAFDRRRAAGLAVDAIERGVPLRDVYLGVFARTQREVGERWERRELSVAEEHFCTAATQLAMAQLYPYLFSQRPRGEVPRPTVVAATVAGELHEMALRIVTDFFEMEGWNTIYLGANTPAAEIARSVTHHRADLVAVSATLYSHIDPLRALIADVRAILGDATPPVLVGGAPFLLAPSLVRFVGADARGRDAEDAVRVAQRLVEGRP